MFRLMCVISFLFLLNACGGKEEVVISEKPTTFELKIKAGWEDMYIARYDVVFSKTSGDSSFDNSDFTRNLTESEIHEGKIIVYAPKEYDNVYIDLWGYKSDLGVSGTFTDYYYGTKITTFEDGKINILNAYPYRVKNTTNPGVIYPFTDNFPTGCTIWTHEDTVIKDIDNSVEFNAICTDPVGSLVQGFNIIELSGTPDAETGEVVFDTDLGVNLYDEDFQSISTLTKHFSLVDKGTMKIDGEFVLAKGEDIIVTKLCFTTPETIISSVSLRSMFNSLSFVSEVSETSFTFFKEGDNTCIEDLRGVYIPKGNQLQLIVEDDSDFGEFYPIIAIAEGTGGSSGLSITGTK